MTCTSRGSPTGDPPPRHQLRRFDAAASALQGPLAALQSSLSRCAAPRAPRTRTAGSPIEAGRLVVVTGSVGVLQGGDPVLAGRGVLALFGGEAGKGLGGVLQQGEYGVVDGLAIAAWVSA